MSIFSDPTQHCNEDFMAGLACTEWVLEFCWNRDVKLELATKQFKTCIPHDNFFPFIFFEFKTLKQITDTKVKCYT